ncbi:hypothetical protein RhiirA5_356748 [Rhizophagus irregularis]|uniref:Uncharacterized protein n=4 Tax=Rhizophagus irregularis TaxID=588596 RepID=U9SMI3_RHIID|nr:hypothetical protein GLOIN_2v1590557 [Rhizophagus irregularis DAOM 181602=DAOM 197198]EXX72613.1 hypothetical protein RirG_067650 [Rhizophagus irregularis DAOM 197198w]PKC09402.1 hypothetical protein RhiirA5_356748 [Rhizophagus irregularis]PKY22630.1 hypothetical protein RhiirB3_410838 [Rhizophagus irregularis]POG73088.1 hypothetical protein GLOIN_2v1590557 [Rhizophagus irregularis DAOM 181602=DAOM 197198]UZO25049.1 hypothetical protein OCT59_017336 [Rhizophagus irregularis]|eukprot:XP_025179954.1 hypothetical protein GLOIN_2v1590557 [Rhizophagus irregularis DAOM 181602=DAOM 197198]
MVISKEESLDNLMVKVEPPNTDVFYVKDNLKEILLYFKRCEIGSFNIPFIKEKIHEINKQGLEFHCCLQQSITQSNKLESHAENVMAYIQILEDPIFDSNRILDILETLLENARMNMEETQQIKNKYSDIKSKLSKINDEFFIRNYEDERKIQSLPEKKEELKEIDDDKDSWVTAITGICFTIGFILLICGLVSNAHRFDKSLELLGSGIVIMIISMIIDLWFKKRNKIRIRKLKNEIKELNALIELKRSEKGTDIEKLCKNLFSVIIQVEAFRTYWETQYYILDDLNRNLRSESHNLKKDCSINQSKKVLVGPIKSRWEQVKAQCNNYTKAVRTLITEIQKT